MSLSLATEVLERRLQLPELLTDTFLRDLHGRLYSAIWTWVGTYRRTEKSVGTAPTWISVELRQSLDNIAYRWVHTEVRVLPDRSTNCSR